MYAADAKHNWQTLQWIDFGIVDQAFHRSRRVMQAHFKKFKAVSYVIQRRKYEIITIGGYCKKGATIMNFQQICTTHKLK